MMPQTISVQSASGTVEVLRKDPIQGPSTEWEAMFPGGRRKSFYGDASDVKHAVEQEIWKTQ
jgi:hypothetical protein